MSRLELVQYEALYPLRWYNLRFVALAIGVCALGCFTSVAIAQHALKPETVSSKQRWLLLAGLVTVFPRGIRGLTHFWCAVGIRRRR